jgi:hypothetical protein
LCGVVIRKFKTSLRFQCPRLKPRGARSCTNRRGRTLPPSYSRACPSRSARKITNAGVSTRRAMSTRAVITARTTSTSIAKLTLPQFSSSAWKKCIAYAIQCKKLAQCPRGADVQRIRTVSTSALPPHATAMWKTSVLSWFLYACCVNKICVQVLKFATRRFLMACTIPCMVHRARAPRS